VDRIWLDVMELAGCSTGDIVMMNVSCHTYSQSNSNVTIVMNGAIFFHELHFLNYHITVQIDNNELIMSSST
jgi:hypothetical protein